jgi:hypothetical protein
MQEVETVHMPNAEVHLFLDKEIVILLDSCSFCCETYYEQGYEQIMWSLQNIEQAEKD